MRDACLRVEGDEYRVQLKQLEDRLKEINLINQKIVAENKKS